MTQQKEVNKNDAAHTRWLMLAILSLDICVSYIPYYTFVPVLRQSMQVYNVDEPALNTLCIMYALVYVPLAFLTAPVVGTLGCRWTYVVAMAFISFGCAIRCGPMFISYFMSVGTAAGAHTTSHASFHWLLFGQTLCAFGQPLLVNTTSEMGAEWFPPAERPTAAMLSNLMNFIGGSVSFIIPPLVVDDHSEMLDVTEMQMQQMLQLEFWIIFLFFLITLFLYQPAPAASLCAPRTPVPLHTEVRRLFCIRDFWLVNGYFSIFVALCHAFDAVEGSLLEHYGYSAALSSWTGVACCITAILSTALESRYISHPSSYRLALLIASAFLAASQFIAFVSLQFQMNWMVFVVAVGVMGLSTPGWGCSCELGSEVCFPAREATVSSILEAFSNLMGVVAIIIVQYLLDAGLGVYVLLLMSLMAAVGGLLLLGMHGKLLRHEAETRMGTCDPEEDKMEVAVFTSSLKDGTSMYVRRMHISSIATGFVVVVILYTVFSIIPRSQLPEISQEVISEIHPADLTVPILSLIPKEVVPWVPERRSGLNASGRWTTGFPEPQNYVINCKEDEGRLNRFIKHMKRAGLNFTVARCVHGTSDEVEASILANLLPSSAAQATEGTTWQGFERSVLIGRAMAHLWLWKAIVDANVTIANIFEDDEVVHRGFRTKRNMLLGLLPSEVDFIKLNAFHPVGSRLKTSGKQAGWMQKVFKMKPRLSAFTNLWMSNYIVTRPGAEKLLEFGHSYDTFGVGAIFDMHITSQVYDAIRSDEFLAYSVGTNVLSHHCENSGLCYKVKHGKKSGIGRVTNCKKTERTKICAE